MGDIQAVFNKVIDAGFYPDSVYMCVALMRARDAEVIDGHEHEMAYDAIHEYLGPFVSMRAAHVYRSGVAFEGDTQKWASTHGVEFYRNWAERPLGGHGHIVGVQVAPVVDDGVDCEVVGWDGARPKMWTVYRRYEDGRTLVDDDFKCPMAAMAYACFLSSTHGVPVEAGVPLLTEITRERHYD